MGVILRSRATKNLFFAHLHLILRQGKSVGLEPQEIINAEPLPETRATLYAWSWMTNETA